MRSARLPFLLVLPVLIAAAIVLHVVHRAGHALDQASVTARDQHHLAFTLQPLDPAALLAQNPGFVPVASAGGYTAGAFLGADLYLAGPAGLTVVAADGSILRQLRTGIELPTASLTALIAGRRRGATEPELLIATSGEGLLVLGGQGTLSQILPSDPDLRDLTAVLPTSTGDLLLGTRRHGLLLYTGSTLEPVPTPGVDSGNLQITSLAPDPSGFWAGTRNSGLLHLHAGTLDHIDRGSGLPDDQVDSLLVTRDRVYAGTPSGIAELDPASARPVRVLAAGSFAHTLALDNDQLVVGTIDQGIQQLSLAPRLRPVAVAASDNTTSVQQFLPSANGLYAVTSTSVLRRRDGRWTPAFVPQASILTDANISALAFAPDGRLWVGFFDRGLDILNPDMTSAADHLEDDSLFCINRLALDPRRHTMAAATANGLVLFDDQGHPRQTLTRRDGLISDHINDLAFTPQGLAVATPAGITFVDASATQSLYAFQGLVNNHVYALGLSPTTGDLLAGTLGGLSVLDNEVVHASFTVTNSGLRHNWITAIQPAPDGSWDIGTYGAGVLHLTRDGRFIPMEIPGKPGLVINPNAMLSTPGHLYAGTLGHGLYVFTRSTAHWTQLTHGLPSGNVTALAGHDGQIYVGTDSGLVRIAESALSRSAQ